MKRILSLLISVAVFLGLMIIPAAAVDLLSGEECVEHVAVASETEHPLCGIPGMTAGTYCQICGKNA